MSIEGLSDDAFAWYRLAGPNPNAICKCTPEVLSKVGALGQAKYTALRAELERLQAAGELFAVDYTVLSGVIPGDPKEIPQFLPSPIALFRLNADAAARARMPITPVLVQVKADAQDLVLQPDVKKQYLGDAFTSADGAPDFSWLIAKTCLQVADSVYHQGFTHLGRTHLVAEAFATAAHRQLSERHPLHRLLMPHFQGTLLINSLASRTLIDENKPVDILLAPNLPQLYELVTADVSAWKSRDWSPDAVLARQGMTASEFPHMFPYRDDAMKVWEAIKTWVAAYMHISYRDDHVLLERDVEVQAWIAELKTTGDVKWLAEAWGPKGHNNLPLLTHLVSTVIFTASAQHGAVNFPQLSVAYTPAFPYALYSEIPTDGEPKTETQYLDLLAPMEIAKLQRVVFLLLSSVYHTRLGHYSHPLSFRRYFESRAARRAAAQFRADLARIGRDIDARNAALVDAWVEAGKPRKEAALWRYLHLHPDKIPQSINI
ncbi:lipoxygenase [Tribonema minus]|uniref:Lipoxygenase n=1 Tax=Tribonema minus TaxID=303371 RepID=A0A836CEV5_9STRA|nr:lipoxygenase [Tribonema minus]